MYYDPPYWKKPPPMLFKSLQEAIDYATKRVQKRKGRRFGSYHHLRYIPEAQRCEVGRWTKEYIQNEKKEYVRQPIEKWEWTTRLIINAEGVHIDMRTLDRYPSTQNTVFALCGVWAAKPRTIKTDSYCFRRKTTGEEIMDSVGVLVPWTGPLVPKSCATVRTWAKKDKKAFDKELRTFKLHFLTRLRMGAFDELAHRIRNAPDRGIEFRSDKSALRMIRKINHEDLNSYAPILYGVIFEAYTYNSAPLNETTFKNWLEREKEGMWKEAGVVSYQPK